MEMSRYSEKELNLEVVCGSTEYGQICMVLTGDNLGRDKFDFDENSRRNDWILRIRGKLH